MSHGDNKVRCIKCLNVQSIDICINQYKTGKKYLTKTMIEQRANKVVKESCGIGCFCKEDLLMKLGLKNDNKLKHTCKSRYNQFETSNKK